MNILIVHAHPEPQSFNGAMTRAAVETLTAEGHSVTVSDLYAMGWNPVSGRRNFTTEALSERYDQQTEERHAVDHHGFAPDLAAEMDKMIAAELVIFQFPIWWLGMPAIMKGWIDRVFAVGVAYGGGRWFDRGRMAPRRAMLSLTTGGGAAPYSSEGVYGPIEPILYPIHHGILSFVGFSVIEPFVVYGPTRLDDTARAAELKRYRERLRTIDAAPVLPQLRSDDFENFVRKVSAV